MAKKKKTTRFKSRSFIESFNHAVDGIISAFKYEVNMRFHLLSAIAALLLSLFFDFSRLELLGLAFSISLVFIAELINTAIEKTVDLLQPEYDIAAGMAKDVAAGAVLVAAVNAVIVAYLLFVVQIENFGASLLSKVRANPLYIAFVAIMIVVLLAIILKSQFSKGHGTHFQGGTVSGHAAVSFSAATVIAAFSHMPLITLLGYLLAFLVSESRVEGGIHKINEVLAGGLMGTLVTVLILALLTQ
jgi:diacylglycerol kinase (ATP)